MMSKAEAEAELVDDLVGLIKLYNDGSVVRAEEPSIGTIPPLKEYKQVLYKDVVFDDKLSLWARIYLPNQSQSSSSSLPVVLYYHGGGFCFYSPATPITHRLCLMWAANLSAIIVSVNYRLAPEHRLPAAYHDSIAALEWLHSQSVKKGNGEIEAVDPWFVSHADFSRVFLAGGSAGGNIAHHVGLWSKNGWEYLRIKGMILICPYFGGEERTPSEIRNAESPVFSLEMSDALWRFALPKESGSNINRDHPFCNPLAFDVSSLILPSALFVIGGQDILCDKQLQYCELLKKYGKQIQVLVFEEEDHGFTACQTEGQNSVKVLRSISDFMKQLV